MANPKWDEQAWVEYPRHRWIFNKLELALRLGYNSAPAGVPVSHPGWYIVRPIYNLSGMGAGARRVWIENDTSRLLSPGEFWCEEFRGLHYSIDYAWTHHPYRPQPVFACQGVRNSNDLFRFESWHKIDVPNVELPVWFDQFASVSEFNVEFVGNKIIEVHLRASHDFPEDATTIVPVWSDTAKEQHQMFSDTDWRWHPNVDDGDGHIKTSRLGFYYK